MRVGELIRQLEDNHFAAADDANAYEDVQVAVACQAVSGFSFEIVAVGEEDGEVVIYLQARKLRPKPSKTPQPKGQLK